MTAPAPSCASLRRRRALTLLAGLALAAPAAAQGPRRILAAGEILRGRFVQERHLQGFARPHRAEGSFVLVPGRGLLWRTEQPFAILTVITAGGLVQEIDGNEVVRLPSAQVPFLARLHDVFVGALGGDWRAVARDFEVVQGGDDRRWTTVLTPRAAGSAGLPLRKVTLSGSAFVDEVRIDKSDADFDKLAFRDQVSSRTPPSAEEIRLLDRAGR